MVLRVRDNKIWPSQSRLIPGRIRMFEPRDLWKVKLWWRADSGLNLTGTNVNSWTDKKSGIVVTPVSTQPVYTASVINGKPGLYGSGYQTKTSGSLASMFPRAGVVYAIIQVSSDSYYSVYESRTYAEGMDSYWNYGGPTYIGTFKGTRINGTSIGDFSTGNHVWKIQSDSSGYKLWVDWVLKISVAGNFHSGATHTMWTTGNGSANFNGYICEIIVLNANPTEYEDSMIRKYLKTRYGL